MDKLLTYIEASDETIHEVFDTWDPDGSGVLELREVEKQLRRGSSIALDPKLQVGGAGEIETQRGGKHALRRGGAPFGRLDGVGC